MNKYVIIVPMAILVAILVTFKVILVHHASAPSAGSIGRIRVTTATRCTSPSALPAWIHSSATNDVAGFDSFYHNVSVATYLGGNAVALTSWHQQQWLFALTVPSPLFQSFASVVEQAFGSIHLPGRGSLFWNTPSHWRLTAVWCASGKAYHLDLTGISPTLAPVVAGVVASWDKSHAALYTCRALKVGITCPPVASSAGH